MNIKGGSIQSDIVIVADIVIKPEKVVSLMEPLIFPNVCMLPPPVQDILDSIGILIKLATDFFDESGCCTSVGNIASDNVASLNAELLMELVAASEIDFANASAWADDKLPELLLSLPPPPPPQLDNSNEVTTNRTAHPLCISLRNMESSLTQTELLVFIS